MPKTPAIDHGAIRDLAKLLDETGLTEIELQRDGMLIRVARNSYPSDVRTPLPPASGNAAPEIVTAPAPAPIEPAQHPGLVASPMVGIAYLGPAPGSPPFVEVGSPV
jgi:acetyl-CoA carboxylase biotin carboxyl carrier protein